MAINVIQTTPIGKLHEKLNCRTQKPNKCQNGGVSFLVRHFFFRWRWSHGAHAFQSRYSRVKVNKFNKICYSIFLEYFPWIYAIIPLVHWFNQPIFLKKFNIMKVQILLTTVVSNELLKGGFIIYKLGRLI